jgi:hypothetical protein
MVDRFITTDPKQPGRHAALKMFLRLLAEFDKRMLNSVICQVEVVEYSPSVSQQR